MKTQMDAWQSFRHVDLPTCLEVIYFAEHELAQQRNPLRARRCPLQISSRGSKRNCVLSGGLVSASRTSPSHLEGGVKSLRYNL